MNLPDAIHVEDQGPADEYGRVPAIVRLNGEVVGLLRYAAWPVHLVLFELKLEEGAPVETEALLVAQLLALYGDAPPARVTHTAITSLHTLRWYASSALRPGVVVCGSHGWRTLFYDPLEALDLEVAPEPRMEGMDAITLTLMYHADLRGVATVSEPGLDDVWAWLHDGDVTTRFVALRRLVVNPRVDPQLTRAALYLALLNENSGVRQFSSIHLGGFFPELRIRADVRGLDALLADPFVVQDRFGRRHEPPGWSPAQARRNARYALVWTLSNVCWNAQGWGAVEWSEEEAAEVRALVEQGASQLDDARDRWLWGLVLADFDPLLQFGFGTPEPVGLVDFLRYAVLRDEVVTRLGLQAEDRFYWLLNAVEGIIGRRPAEPGGSPLDRIWAPPPCETLPSIDQMPSWMYGKNHNQLYAPVEVDHEGAEAT